uniref:Uncharacterized protein n=1 Tax=Rhizophora mucronata TaxID=61149 RepID=A0A2P2PJN0_RHIMU
MSKTNSTEHKHTCAYFILRIPLLAATFIFFVDYSIHLGDKRMGFSQILWQRSHLGTTIHNRSTLVV